ncbi:unnamed protein product [Trifolium pratense]|uniref:Uncharacterized protein n=1 Tax=Trifolium pratense TaxID=57577 RepID=A0ACB0JY39_TRIPR|nr:unnamed protein product [Trifolium pratense]
MNFDDLLKNVISAESDQLMQNPSSYAKNVISDDSNSNSNNNSFFIGSTSGNNLNETLCNKTFNGVWSEINHQKHAIGGSMKDHNNLQQSILGETAFEDFLTHAKAFNMGNQDSGHVIGDANQVPFIGIESKLVMASQPEHWLPFQMPIPIQMQHQEHQNRQIIDICQDFNVAKPVYENQVMDIGYSENSLAMSMPIGATTMSFPSTCSDSKGVVVAAAAGGGGGVGVGRKHKYSDEMMEKTIERRQKRMAKNRESAARSRAKKQVSKTRNA